MCLKDELSALADAVDELAAGIEGDSTMFQSDQIHPSEVA